MYRRTAVRSLGSGEPGFRGGRAGKPRWCGTTGRRRGSARTKVTSRSPSDMDRAPYRSKRTVPRQRVHCRVRGPGAICNQRHPCDRRSGAGHTSGEADSRRTRTSRGVRIRKADRAAIGRREACCFETVEISGGTRRASSGRSGQLDCTLSPISSADPEDRAPSGAAPPLNGRGRGLPPRRTALNLVNPASQRAFGATSGRTKRVAMVQDAFDVLPRLDHTERVRQQPLQSASRIENGTRCP
jgi:hypothetical protein